MKRIMRRTAKARFPRGRNFVCARGCLPWTQATAAKIENTITSWIGNRWSAGITKAVTFAASLRAVVEIVTVTIEAVDPSGVIKFGVAVQVEDGGAPLQERLTG